MKLPRIGFPLLVAVLVPAFLYAGPALHPVAEGCVFPTVTSVSPNTGSTLGGTSVTITGTGFFAPATVTFGGNAAGGVVVVSSTTITALTPPGAAGPVDVVVTTTCGPGTLPGGFTYSATAPVPALSPLAMALLAVALGLAAVFVMRR